MPRRVEALLEEGPDALERAVAGEQHEGVPVEPAGDLVNQRGHLQVVRRVVIGGRILGEDADGLSQIVERRRQGRVPQPWDRCRRDGE